MSRNYKFHNPNGVYFVSLALVEWIDVFTRNEYKNIFLERMRYCQKNKGLEIFSRCIMTSHVHLVFRAMGEQKPDNVLGDLKRFTSRKIIDAIQTNSRESRKEWMLKKFKSAGASTSNATAH